MRYLQGLSTIFLPIRFIMHNRLPKWQESRNGNIGLPCLLHPLSTWNLRPPPLFTVSCVTKRDTWPNVPEASWNSRRSNRLTLLKLFLLAPFKNWITLSGFLTLVQPLIWQIILTTWMILLRTLVMKGWWLVMVSLCLFITLVLFPQLLLTVPFLYLMSWLFLALRKILFLSVSLPNKLIFV